MPPALRPPVAFCAAMLAACVPFSNAVIDEQLDGPYRLVAPDLDEQSIVCIAGPDDVAAGFCSGDGLPGPAVFTAGADALHVVIGRHPWEHGQALDRSVTQYYYLVRRPDELRGLPPGNVHGPFTAEQFEAEKRRLHLPDFSRTLDELK